jgi:hypothetical protein
MAVAGFAHCGFGHYGVEVVLVCNNAAGIDLNIYEIGVNSEDGCAASLEEHGFSAASVAGLLMVRMRWRQIQI